MRRMLMTALCLFALPALAAEPAMPRGQWQITLPHDPTFSGVVLIDGGGRVTWDAVWNREARIKSGMKPVGDGKASWRGYVRTISPTIELTLTNGDKVDRVFCSTKSNELLHCYTFLPNGDPSALTVLRRVGDGPETLTPPPH